MDEAVEKGLGKEKTEKKTRQRRERSEAGEYVEGEIV